MKVSALSQRRREVTHCCGRRDSSPAGRSPDSLEETEGIHPQGDPAGNVAVERKEAGVMKCLFLNAGSGTVL